MWGIEHTAMATTAGCFALWLTVKVNWSWLGAALLSQVPFWLGSAYYWHTGDKTPLNVNLALNLLVASAFVGWGTRLQSNGRGGIVHIWVCLIFLLACSIDVLQVVYPVPFYMLAQEAVHYMALIAIGGRAYVRGLDGRQRHHRNLSGSGKSGWLV